jgi:hypothetical protein
MARFDPVEKRIEKLVKRLDAEEFTIAVEYDTNNRHRSMNWGKEWRVDIKWCRRGWRSHPTDERTESGFGHTLTEALDRLDEKVNALLFLDGTEATADV